MKEFRCPFEVKGIEDGTIIDVSLTENKEERVAMMRAAVKQFHEDHTRTAIRFTLPSSVLRGCSSNLELRDVIVPYQTEFLAAEIDYLLHPFLLYQWEGRTDKELDALGEGRPIEALAAYMFADMFGESGSVPRDVGEFASVLESLFRKRIDAGETNPLIMLNADVGSRKLIVMRLDLSAAGVSLGKGDMADPKFNRSTFTIVKTPFYPKAFGRYSDNVEIVVNRNADVHALSLAAQKRIRRSANEVYAAHGVRIDDLDNAQQPTGLWLPEEPYKIV